MTFAWRGRTGIGPAVSGLTLTEPSGSADGDLHIAVFSWEGTGSIDAPSGWTLAEELVGDADNKARIWTQQRSGTPNLTWTASGTVGVRAGELYTYSGASGVPSVAATRTQTGGGGTTTAARTLTLPSVDTVANQLLFAWASHGDSADQPGTFDATGGPTTASSATIISTAALSSTTWQLRQSVKSAIGNDICYGAGDALASTITGEVVSAYVGSRSSSINQNLILLVVNETTATGVTINAPSKDTALAGAAPTVSAGASVAPPAADTAFAALAPDVVSGASVTVPAADTALAALAPSISTGAAVVIPAADIALSGAAPSVASGASVAAPAADIALAALAPAVASGVAVTVPAADLAVLALAPSIEAATGTLVSVPAADVAILAHAPTIVAAPGAIEVPAADVSVAAVAPGVSTGAIVLVGPANTTLAALAPSIIAVSSVVIFAPAANFNVVGRPPVVQAWGPAPGPSGTWTDATTPPETWTPVSPSGGTWSDAA